MRRPVLVSLVCLNLVLTLLLGLFMARSVLAENGSVAAVTVRSAGAQEYVKVVGSTDVITITNTFDWIPITSAAIAIPAGHADLISVDFFAESYCFHATDASPCLVRMRVGTTELAPAAGSDFSFDVAREINSVNYSRESQAMSRFVCLNGGANGATYRVYVEGLPNSLQTVMEIDDWTLRLTRSHGCATS
jgi:hypothetical protein